MNKQRLLDSFKAAVVITLLMFTVGGGFVGLPYYLLYKYNSPAMYFGVFAVEFIVLITLGLYFTPEEDTKTNAIEKK